MTKAIRPLPFWLRWSMRILGVFLILYCIWALFILGVGFWLLAHTKDGILGKDGMLLAEGLGRLVGTLLILWLGVWLLKRPSKKAADATRTVEMQTEEVQTQPTEAPRVVAPVAPVARPTGNKNWQLCNVLQADGGARTFWQFDAAQKFALKSELRSREGDPLPPNLVAKSWGALFKKKLNVAWLPANNVFLRVAQFPASSPDETRAMVELQLEKLSPIPVTQALWTMHVLPKTATTGEADNLQTIVVIVVARNVVEEFLGKLEGQGYMADRLELPMLDQLQSTRVAGDGAWVYPETHGIESHALVAWWYGGVLQNLALVTLDSSPNRIASLKDQLVQMTWAGELEGWLTSLPHWHLVGDANDPWYSALREALEVPIEVAPPVPPQELAAMTAKRAANFNRAENNLLPPEFAVRYQQQFVDRLWGRGLLAALVVYGICLAIYFVALTVFTQLTSRVEARANGMSQSYTNSIQLKEMLGVLKQRETLKFAALDCWEAVAETMPTGLTLETLNFNDGRTLTLRGTAPTDQVTTITDFFDSLRKWKKDGKQQVFDVNSGDAPHINVNAGGGTVSWSFELELKQGGKE